MMRSEGSRRVTFKLKLGGCKEASLGLKGVFHVHRSRERAWHVWAVEKRPFCQSHPSWVKVQVSWFGFGEVGRRSQITQATPRPYFSLTVAGNYWKKTKSLKINQSFLGIQRELLPGPTLIPKPAHTYTSPEVGPETLDVRSCPLYI